MLWFEIIPRAEKELVNLKRRERDRKIAGGDIDQDN